MHKSLSLQERLDSLKAGLVAGILAMVAEGLFQVLQVYAWPTSIPETVEVFYSAAFWGDLAIAGLSGFLFGVTCRYAIRRDNNPHLSSGVILAFGLVRGLAQVRLEQTTPEDLFLTLFAILESLGIFTVAYLGLSATLRRGWVKPLL